MCKDTEKKLEFQIFSNIFYLEFFDATELDIR